MTPEITPQAKEITIRYFVVDPKDIVYLKAVLESYEGMVVVRTVTVGQPVIELLMARDFVDYLAPVLKELGEKIPLKEIQHLSEYSPPLD